jgi:hypothetical protein
MKRTVFQCACLTLFLVVLSPCAAAQEETPEAGARYVWTGRLARDGAFVSVLAQLPPVQELEQILLSVEVERDFEGALAALDDLRIRATYSAHEGMDTLVRIAQERAALLARLGRLQEARVALERLLVSEEEKRAHAGRYELKLAEAAARILEVKTLTDPRLKAVRARIEAGQIQGPDGAAAGIETAVREAISFGVVDVVYDIGPRAAPALERLLLEDPDAFPGHVEFDPLGLLLLISELRGAALIEEHWEAGGFFWKKRIVRAMLYAEVLTNEGTWQVEQGEAPRLLEPGWLPILARLVHDPEVGRDAIPLVQIVAFNDALSPELQVGLGVALRSSDPDLVREVLSALVNTRAKLSTEPVVGAALDHPDAEVRRFACEHLLSFSEPASLLAAEGHEDPMVRSFVARALRWREREPVFFEQRGYEPVRSPTTFNSWGFLRPVIGESERAILARLAADPVADVRVEAVRSLQSAPAGSVGEALRASLAQDPSSHVRAAAASIRHPDPRVDAAALAVFAADADPAVLWSVDERLHAIADAEFDAGRLMEPYLGVLDIRRANGALAMDAALEDDQLHSIFSSAVQSDAGIALVAAWGIDERDDKLLALLVDEAPWRASDSWGANVGMGSLDDERLAEVYARGLEISRDAFQRVLEGVEAMRPPRTDALRRILVDRERSRLLRSFAAYSAAPGGGEGLRSELLAFLREAFNERAPESYESTNLGALARRLPYREWDAFLLAVATDTEIPDAIGTRVFRELADRGGFGPDVAAAAVTRWYGVSADRNVVSEALLRLQTKPGEPLSDLLLEAARVSDYYESAIAALGRLGHDEYLPTLGDCLRADWVQDQGERVDVQDCAVRALSGYLTDEAAQYLLDGLGRIRDDRVRTKGFAALEAIRRYQDERRLWNERKAGQQARERAVNQLLGMVGDEDPEVRAYAVRSLATLDAVEHLPDMVRALADEHPMVREAAQEALEILTRDKKAASSDQ